MTTPHSAPWIQRLPRHTVPVAVLALSLLLTFGGGLALMVSTRARDRARFETWTQETSDRIRYRLDTYTALLLATRGLFATQREVTLEEFSQYVQLLEIQAQYPGIQGIGFVERFSARERATLEQRVRVTTGLADFHVWPEPREPDADLFPIIALEPRDTRNQAALGFDMYSEPVRHEAMARARDTGQPALTAKVTLKQEIGLHKQAGFLLYLPVYRSGHVPETVEARREALVGFVYSPFRAEDLLHGIFGTGFQPRVAFQLHDGMEVAPESLLYSSSGPEDAPREPLFTATTRLTMAGRPWTIVFSSLPVFDETTSQRMVPPIIAAGVLVSLVLFLLARAQRRALVERARVAEQLAEADQRKDDFLAMLAHELRNPLAPLLTAVQLMERKRESGEDVRREREVMERQVQHLRRLVDDLLDVSRVSRGKVHLRKQPLELGAEVARALEAARSFAESRGHTLRAVLPEGPVWADADPVRLGQVLTNLLHNAAKYSEPGGHITLTLAREGREAVMRVEDTGMGIPADALPHLFEPFMQVARTLDRSQGGLGLGLALVKQLVEMHEGRVEVSSAGVGRGSVFTVRLPVLPEARVPAVGGPPSPGQAVPSVSRRVLVVDDNLDAAMLLGEALELEGHRVVLVHDGPAALTRARELAPDVVFLDIGLPGLDGYEVARRLRSEGGSFLLVALTGYGQASDRQRSREAGFDVHLIKPVELDVVRELVANPTGASRSG